MNGPHEQGPIGPELLGRLLDELGPALAFYAAQWTEAADDCVQDALVELARQPSRPENVRAWLFRVVRHRALNVARSAKRRREREQRAAQTRLTTTGRSVADPFDVLVVTEALASLEPDERELIVMRIWGNLTYEEIAASLDIGTSTVHRQYQKALERLRHRLESPCTTNTTNQNLPRN